jgi:hypothetical protein
MSKKANNLEMPSSDAPLTWREVVEAVFLVPQQQPQENISAPVSTEYHKDGLAILTPDERLLFMPSSIHYADSPVESHQISGGRQSWLTAGIMIALALGVAAQYRITASQDSLWGGALYLIAAVVWVAVVLREFYGNLLQRGPRVVLIGEDGIPEVREDIENTPAIRIALGSLGFILSIATYLLTGDNLFTVGGVIAWITSVGVWMLVLADRDVWQILMDWKRAAVRWQKPVIGWSRQFVFQVSAAVIIFGVAVFFRLYQLHSIPGEMTSDHVEKLLDAFDVATGHYHVFFPNNGGREAIQFYLVPLLASVFGTGMSFITLKITTVLESLLLIPLIVLLGHEIVDTETGLFAAALLAMSWWGTALGRLGLRIVLTPVFYILVLVVLIRAIRTRSRRAWLWAGLWMGVGVYAYQAMRIMPLVALFAFLISSGAIAWQAWKLRKQAAIDLALIEIGKQAGNFAASGIIALAIFVPMLRFWHDAPEALWNRVINRTTSNEVAITAPSTQIFTDNYVRALQMFNIHGDVAWISGVPGAPVLDQVSGVLLIFGVLAWLVRLRARRDPVDLFVIIAGLIMLLPSALAIAFPIENPSLTRASGALPFVMILAAWPLALARQKWFSLGNRVWKVGATVLVCGILGVIAYNNYQTYFVDFKESYDASALNPGEVADAVREVIGPDATLDGVWLQGWPYWHDFRAIGIEAGDIRFQNAILDFAMLQDYLANFPEKFAVRPLVFIVHVQDQESLQFLQKHFPHGYSQLHPNVSEKRNFYLFIVPRD